MQKKIYLPCFVMLIAVLCASCGRKVVTENYSIIPQPAEMTMDKGYFTLSSSTKCYAGGVGQNDQSVKFIFSHLRQWHFNPVLIGTPEANSLQLIINETSDSELGDEGYTIDVGKDGIVIAANSERGLFYGFQTFVQMLPEDISVTRYSKISLPFCHIRDYPQYEWRGSLLDVSRHFFGISQVKKHLDLMAQYKLNKFHWHLTDDHGWRIEIAKYPLLNDIGSWRVDRDNQPWGEADPPREGEARTNGGYYTKAEIEEIVAYAAERYIDVIPEIEIPGHCCAVLEAYPQLACADDDTTYTVQYGPYWPPRAILCAGNDSVMMFLKDVMDEIIPLFPSKYIHIGGDEAVKENWERCPRCAKRMKELGLSDFEQLQGWMVVEMENYLKRQGKNIIGWDEILDGGVSADATVMSWRGSAGGIKASRHGNDVIMTPLDYCYFNFYQANAEFQPAAMPNSLVTLHKVYGFDPSAGISSERQREHILGAQCNLWTEYINTPEMAEYMLLPRLCAMAEVLWTPETMRNWEDFRGRVSHHCVRLKANDYNVGSGSFQPWVTYSKDSEGRRMATLHWEVEGTRIYYHTGDGVFKRYTEPFEVNKNDKITTLSFFNGMLKEKAYEL